MKFSLAVSMCDPSHYLPLARSAERSGWDSLCVPDGGPWTAAASEAYSGGGDRWWGPETAFLDPFVAIPAMAAVTERIHFHTNVYKLPAHSPIHTARTIASIWSFAPGRFALGVGLGWNREEFDALGIDFDTRGGRADESIALVRRLIAGEWVEHEGRHFTLPRLRQSPCFPEHLPIYAGGDSAAAMRRAARFCDGWIARAPAIEDLAQAIPKMEAALAREGRSREGFRVLAMCPDATDAAHLDRLEALGIDEVELWPWNRDGVGLEDLAAKCDSVERFAEEVIEPFRAAR